MKAHRNEDIGAEIRRREQTAGQQRKLGLALIEENWASSLAFSSLLSVFSMKNKHKKTAVSESRKPIFRKSIERGLNVGWRGATAGDMTVCHASDAR